MTTELQEFIDARFGLYEPQGKQRAAHERIASAARTFATVIVGSVPDGGPRLALLETLSSFTDQVHKSIQMFMPAAEVAESRKVEQSGLGL